MSATQKFFRYLFGVAGDRVAVPDTTPVDGSVNYQAGYGFDYQRAQTDPLVKNIERNKLNQILYEITLGLRQYQTHGFPEFIQPVDNGGLPYSYDKNSYVIWTDGQVYVSLVDANTSDPTDVTKWQLALLGAGVGQITYYPATTPPTGYLKANGALLSRAAYPVLWAYAQASGNMAVSDGAWQSGQFSPGNGTTTFRIPDLRGYHLRAYDDGRGIDSGRVLGSVQSDLLGSHTHGITVDNVGNHTHTIDVANAGSHAHAISVDGVGNHTHANGIFANLLRPPYNGSLTGNDNTGSGAEQPVSPGDAQEIVAAGAHSHTASAAAAGVHDHTASAANAGSHTHTASAAATGGAETRVKNVALVACIKYL